MDYLPPAWNSGPISDKELRPHHGQPVNFTQIYSLSVWNDQVVTSSGDHGLRVFNINSGQHIRQLYNKNYGHTEWVPTCKFLRDGRIVSGGMDGLICVWDKRAVRCDNLREHNGSVSEILVDDRDFGVSLGYDHSAKVWNFNSLRMLVNCQGSNPLMCCDWYNSLLVTGDRGGQIRFFDINSGTCIFSCNNHSGAVSKVFLQSDNGGCNVVGSAGLQDGKVILHDMRSHETIFNQKLHTGAINLLKMNMSNTLVTGSTDSALRILDGYSNFQQRGVMQATGSITCGQQIGGLVVVGCSDGNIVAFNTDIQDCLFGYGADNTGAINCLSTGLDNTRLVTGGDSGVPLLMFFN